MALMPSLRSARFVALIFATAFSASLGAACAEAAFATPNAQMACCKDGELTCAPHGSASDCCLTDAAGPRDAVTVAKMNPVRALAAVVVAWATLPSPATLDAARPRMYEPASPPRLAFGPPPYIAFSSLLI